jgi:hypothetical protein
VSRRSAQGEPCLRHLVRDTITQLSTPWTSGNNLIRPALVSRIVVTLGMLSKEASIQMTRSILLRLLLSMVSVGFLGSSSPENFSLKLDTENVTAKLGDAVLLKIETENHTDRIARPEAGIGGGLLVEFHNAEGADVTDNVVGKAPEDLSVVLSSQSLRISPGGRFVEFMRVVLKNGSIPQGKYSVRVSRLDRVTRNRVFSNTIEVTITP